MGSRGPQYGPDLSTSSVGGVYLTVSVYTFVLQKSISAQISQLILYIGNSKR